MPGCHLRKPCTLSLADLNVGKREPPGAAPSQSPSRERLRLRYLVNNSKLIHYDRALAAGLPLATGAIEGACRYLLEDRLGITGARWSLRSAEAVLKLRAVRFSGDLDEYWGFHLAQERVRNHEVRYADRQVPGPLWPSKPT